MEKTKVVGKETADVYKKRLRTTALRTPKAEVCKSLRGMKKRILSICKEKGGRIKIE
jgi:hypothetical protein